MIEPTEADIGRVVVYRPTHRRYERTVAEEGVITSFNDSYVFVRYGTYGTARATRRSDLEWQHGKADASPGSNGTD